MENNFLGVALERECPNCGGRGWKVDTNPFVRGNRENCNHCEGTGKVLTEAGEQLIDFVSRYLLRIRKSKSL